MAASLNLRPVLLFDPVTDPFDIDNRKLNPAVRYINRTTTAVFVYRRPVSQAVYVLRTKRALGGSQYPSKNPARVQTRIDMNNVSFVHLHPNVIRGPRHVRSFATMVSLKTLIALSFKIGVHPDEADSSNLCVFPISRRLRCRSTALFAYSGRE